MYKIKIFNPFSQITNQIVIACKNYISDSGKQEFLQMDPAIAQKKVKMCLGLYFLYKTHMGTSKRHIVEDSHRTFKLHQVPVMATFDSFRKRLDLVNMFSPLNSQFHNRVIDVPLILQQTMQWNFLYIKKNPKIITY